MKLVFYDEMPNSPGLQPGSAKVMSQWVSRGKDLASKVSDQATSTIKRKLSRQNINAPVTVTEGDDVLLEKHHFRPLDLSIYLPGNRLSELPEFGNVDFTVAHKTQIPPMALSRSRSENTLQTRFESTSRPAASSVGKMQLDHSPQRPSSSSSQRPSRACGGLNSHPPCWTSSPDHRPQVEAVKPLNSIAEPSTFLRKTLDSPRPVFRLVDEGEQHRASHPTTTALPTMSIQVPDRELLRRQLTRSSSFKSTRLAQWLSLSSSSTLTTSPDPPTTQLYQDGRSLPLDQHLVFRYCSRSSVSTQASNVDSSTESLASMTSMTTAPTVHSRVNCSGSASSFGKRVTVVEEESLADISDTNVVIQEDCFEKAPVNGRLEIGMAI